jgi:hypothetical protein
MTFRKSAGARLFWARDARGRLPTVPGGPAQQPLTESRAKSHNTVVGLRLTAIQIANT